LGALIAITLVKPASGADAEAAAVEAEMPALEEAA
jgi:hypothetical protein